MKKPHRVYSYQPTVQYISVCGLELLLWSVFLFCFVLTLYALKRTGCVALTRFYFFFFEIEWFLNSFYIKNSEYVALKRSHSFL